MSTPGPRQGSMFRESEQTTWSTRVLNGGRLPDNTPDILTDDVVVPLAFVVDEPFGAVLHTLLWCDEDDDAAPRCDVEVLYRDPSEVWTYVGSGGSGWPSTHLVDLTDDQLGGSRLLVLGRCEIGTPVGIGAFTYGVVSRSTSGVEFVDPLGVERHWPKMRCGAFVVPTRLVADSLRPWVRTG